MMCVGWSPPPPAPQGLTESGLVLSDEAVVGPRNGKLYLMIRWAVRHSATHR